MPRLNKKKVIKLVATLSFTKVREVEVNPSVRLTEVQKLIDEFVEEIHKDSPHYTVEVTAEGLV